MIRIVSDYPGPPRCLDCDVPTAFVNLSTDARHCPACGQVFTWVEASQRYAFGCSEAPVRKGPQRRKVPA